MAENYMLMTIAISIMLNVIILGFLIFSGVGRYSLKRLINKAKVRKGTHVNTLLVTKNGQVIEYCSPVQESGEFNYNERKYVRNLSLIFNYFGTPTYLHKEGFPDPLNPFNDQDKYKLSCNEMDIVMYNESTVDIKTLFKKYALIFFLAIIIMVVVTVVAIYFSASGYQLLRDGSLEVICKAAQNAGSTVAKAFTTGGA